jgi:GLPGLI family protein
VYQTKTTIDMKLDSTRFSPEQQKRIKERMKSNFEKVYVLSFNTSESIYKEEEKLEQPGQGGGRRFGGFGSGTVFKNTKAKTYTKEQDLTGKMFLIKDNLDVLEWDFKDESKLVGQHLCFKAVAKRMVPNIEQFRFGRGNNSSENKPKDSLKLIEVVAWYTPDIPVSNGPGDYWGLPGLILEINADNTQIVCTKLVINPKDKVNIKKPSKGKVVTQKEYDDIFTKKMKEMREMYGGRGERGRGRGRGI